MIWIDNLGVYAPAGQCSFVNGLDSRICLSAFLALDTLAAASCSTFDDSNKCLLSKIFKPGSSLCRRWLSPFAANLPSVGLQPNRYVRFRCVPSRQRR